MSVAVIQPDLRYCLGVALLASQEAGDAILEVYGSEFAVSYKGDRSPVTQADRRSHDVLMRHLAGTHGRHSDAGIPFMSEEGRDIPYAERRHWHLFWLVDPLDGTKEFLKRNGEFTVNIALIEGTKPILGVVYLPATDALYFAARGFGAYGTQGRLLRELLKSSCADDPALMADRLLQVSERLPSVKPEQHAGRVLRFVHSSSHHSQEEEAFISNVKASFGALETVSAGSSLKFCLVAQGNADVYPRFGPTMEWDTAAGQCVVEEAGGRVDVIEGGPLPYNRQDLRNPTFIATGTRIQKESDSRDLIMKCVPVHS